MPRFDSENIPDLDLAKVSFDTNATVHFDDLELPPQALDILTGGDLEIDVVLLTTKCPPPVAPPCSQPPDAGCLCSSKLEIRPGSNGKPHKLFIYLGDEKSAPST